MVAEIANEELDRLEGSGVTPASLAVGEQMAGAAHTLLVDAMEDDMKSMGVVDVFGDVTAHGAHEGCSVQGA